LWLMVLFFEALGLFLLAVWQDVIQPRTMEFRVIAVVSLILTWLAAAPFIRFLDRGWYVRYDEFQNALTDSATRTYLSNFWANRIEKYGIAGSPSTQNHLRAISTLSQQETQALFERVYIDQYGIAPFIVPLAVIVTIVFGESILAVFLVYHDIEIWGAGRTLIISAIAGAYLFSIGDAVLSVRKRSLNVSDLYWYALRLALAIPIGIAFGAAGNGAVGHTVVAFSISALPVDVLIKLIRRFASKAILSSESDEAPDQLISLQGVTVATSALLAAEGVTSIEQLVAMDPILISIRTGLPFSLILFLNSQAVVRRRFGEGADKVRTLGLVDAQSIAALLRIYEMDEEVSGCKTPPPGVQSENAASAQNHPIQLPETALSFDRSLQRDDVTGQAVLKGHYPPPTAGTLHPLVTPSDARQIVLAVTTLLHTPSDLELEGMIRVTLFQFGLVRDDPCTRFLLAAAA
jgi:hypothetical protein